MEKINQKKLARKMYDHYPKVKIRHIENLLEVLKETILDEVANDNQVNLLGFGKFEKLVRKGRYSLNPQTKEKVWVDPLPTLKFRPGYASKQYLKGKK